MTTAVKKRTAKKKAATKKVVTKRAAAQSNGRSNGKSNGSHRVVSTPANARATTPAPPKHDPQVAPENLIPPIERMFVSCTIVGMSPLIQHKWSEKAKGQMRDKHAGKKTKNREVRDTKAEGKEAAYLTEKGKHGVPLLAIKAAMLTAAHKDLGIPRTIVSKGLFIPSTDKNGILEMDCSKPRIVEDPVRVGNGSTDLRYRPYFDKWSVPIVFEVDAGLLQVKDVITLCERAGFGVGIGEWRPEKGGEYGRFMVADDSINVVAPKDMGFAGIRNKKRKKRAA